MAIEEKLFSLGLGNRENLHGREYFSLYDRSDLEFDASKSDEITFIKIFEGIPLNQKAPDLFVYNDTDGKEKLILLNWDQFKLAYSNYYTSAEVDLSKISLELKEKYLNRITKVASIENQRLGYKIYIEGVHIFDQRQLKRNPKDSDLINSVNSQFQKLMKKTKSEDPWKNPMFAEFMQDLFKNQDGNNRRMIENNAKNFRYHDFGPNVFAKSELLTDLKNADFTDMYKKAIAGKYDF